MIRSVETYVNRIPSANRSQDKFVAFLSALLGEFVDTQTTIDNMSAAFDIDTAVGVQLDAIGERVGFSRILAVPISGVYFSLDQDGVGLDQGILMMPFDSPDGLTRLDDETYRLLLKLKVRANTWDGSSEDAQAIFNAVAGNGAYIFIQDYFNMQIALCVSGVVPSKLFVSILKQMKEWLKPSGVQIVATYVTGESGSPLFGLDVQNEYIGGLDSGTIGVEY